MLKPSDNMTMFGDFETMMNENEVGCFMRYDLDIGSLPIKHTQDFTLSPTPTTISSNILLSIG